MRDTKINCAIGAIHDHRYADHFPTVRADDLHGFFDTAALSDDVFNDKDAFAGRNLEAAAKGEFAFLLFDEDETTAELAGDFLTDDEAAHRGRNHGGGGEGSNLLGKGMAEFFDNGHFLEGERALEELARMKAAAEDEMSF